VALVVTFAPGELQAAMPKPIKPAAITEQVHFGAFKLFNI
jgi:hypothetical protein